MLIASEEVFKVMILPNCFEFPIAKAQYFFSRAYEAGKGGDNDQISTI